MDVDIDADESSLGDGDVGSLGYEDVSLGDGGYYDAEETPGIFSCLGSIICGMEG